MTIAEYEKIRRTLESIKFYHTVGGEKSAYELKNEMVDAFKGACKGCIDDSLEIEILKAKLSVYEKTVGKWRVSSDLPELKLPHGFQCTGDARL